MILGQISFLDCIVFLVLLTPQLLFHVGLFTTALWIIQALPFLGKIGVKPLLILTDGLTNNLDSSKAALSIYTRTLFHAQEIADTICGTGDTIPRCGHSLCTLCIQVYARIHRKSVLFETGGFAVPSLSNASAWLFSFTFAMERSQHSKLNN
jgi:hypothetical protein